MLLRNKIFIVMAVLVLSLSLLLCSCGETQDPGVNDVTTTDAVETTVNENAIDPENIEIKLGEDGKVNFKFVRPDSVDANDPCVAAAQSMLTAIKDLLGTAPKLNTDYVMPGVDRDPDALEILVGLTNYDETAEVVAECVGYDAYSIKVVGNKIVVVAYNSDAYTKAADDIVKLMQSGYDEAAKKITLKASVLNRSVSSESQLSALPFFDGGVFGGYYDAGERVVGQSCDEIIVKEVTPELYGAYLKKLESAGYKQYVTNEAAGNKFATYTNDKYTLNVGYYDYEKSARLLIEPLAPATGLKDENKYTKITESQITMMGLAHDPGWGSGVQNNGLCIVIRLEDGRFVIIDGGFASNGNYHALANLIKEQSSAYTTTPTIAAWMVTHDHGDHQGPLHPSYVSYYSNDGIKIEKVLTNFMSDSELQKSVQAKKWEHSGVREKDRVLEFVEMVGATLYRVHVGQKFYIADLEMEILYTIESYAPELTNALNTTSIVAKLTFGGKTTYLSTGDATGDAMDITQKMYGDYLKCDIVQVCHHGYTTYGNEVGMKKAYTAINASLALWPQHIGYFPSYVGKNYNTAIFAAPNYKECYVSGNLGELTVVKLPYTVGEVVGPHPYVKK